MNLKTNITAKLIIFNWNITKQKGIEFNFGQLSHSMSVPKISSYARIQGKTTSLATAKLAIFSTDILWESCSKYDL